MEGGDTLPCVHDPYVELRCSSTDRAVCMEESSHSAKFGLWLGNVIHRPMTVPGKIVNAFSDNSQPLSTTGMRGYIVRPTPDVL